MYQIQHTQAHNKNVPICQAHKQRPTRAPSKQTHVSQVVPVSGLVSLGQHAAIRFIRNPILEGESAHEGSQERRRKQRKTQTNATASRDVHV